VQPQAAGRYWSAIAIVSRAIDELVVGRKVGGADYGEAMVHFKDLFGAGIR
jgi:hypothetical protein